MKTKSSRYIKVNKNNNKEDPKFKVNDHIRTQMFVNVYTASWSQELFVIKKKVKNTVQWRYFISDFKVGEVFGMFHKKELQKKNHIESRVKKAINQEKRW